MPRAVDDFGQEYDVPGVRETPLCCLVHPYVRCRSCYTPSCKECAHQPFNNYHDRPCDGDWFLEGHGDLFLTN